MAQTYRVRPRNKYGNRRVTIDGYTFDSGKEGNRYMELKYLLAAGQIKDLELQKPFVLQEGFRDKHGKWHREIKYIADFVYYDNEKEGIKRKPIVIVDGLKDLTGGKSPTEDIDYLLCTASESLRNKLIKLGSFDAKDDKEKVAVAKRIIESDTSPLENPELMAALKRHGSPDFYCAGDLRYFKESKKYRLRIAVHSLRTGKIVWEDSVDIEKEVGGRP